MVEDKFHTRITVRMIQSDYTVRERIRKHLVPPIIVIIHQSQRINTMNTYILFALPLLVHPLFGHQIFNNVPTYFGGSDNDAYLTWADSIAVNHLHSVYLTNDDETYGMAIHWTIGEDDTIHLAMATRATGWMALGFSENGGMFGADVMYWEAQKPDIVNDAYILDTRGVSLDDCQDWTLIDAVQEEPFIMIQASRRLNTSDTQDRVLQNDSMVEMPLSFVLLRGVMMKALDIMVKAMFAVCCVGSPLTHKVKNLFLQSK
jgi:hypothetical protein